MRCHRRLFVVAARPRRESGIFVDFESGRCLLWSRNNWGRIYVPILVVLTICLLVPGAALAERLFDLYGGYNFTQDDDSADVQTTRFLLSDDAEFEGAPLVGVRLGAWFEGYEFAGGAIDVSYFETDGEGGFDDVEIAALPVSALLMFRLPLLRGDSFTQGRIQPYVAMGPSVLVSQFKLNTDAFGTLRDTSVDIGADGRLGAAFLFTPGVGIFLEYRFTYFEPRYEDIHFGTEAKVSPRLLTHYAQLGLTMRF